MRNLIDLSGKKFGMLTVVRLSDVRAKNVRTWECVCDCGGQKIANTSKLQALKVRSCGCLISKPKHGHALRSGHSAEYDTWCAMIARCTKPHNRDYGDYGGRGIAVCERWLKSYQSFFDDMGPRPSPKHSIDRKNNDGNYEPSNCRWATRRIQNFNRRNTIKITFSDGSVKTLLELEQATGIPRKKLYHRLEQGWGPDELCRPIKFYKPRNRAADPAQLRFTT